MSIPKSILIDYVREITNISDDVHRSCVDAGWYTDLLTNKRKDRNIPEMLMLIVSELAEGMEGYRKGLMDNHLPHRTMLEVELADTLIRIFDLAGYLLSIHAPEGARSTTDIGTVVMEKLLYNFQRADHKIENRMTDNGKKF